ncbi:thioesterase family protein [Halobacillus litoralis]|uniref:thioesterase family protein n=1 Tax=Halobacillus litoralis TaxID=45668 RepID=UPI001CFE2A0F|nr:thioesterase family protein [Halobacillus litoralis]
MNQDILLKQAVPSEWVDYNGHMNDAEYSRAFSLATDAFIDSIGLHEDARSRYQYTIYTLETHLCYLKEIHEGAEFEIKCRILDYDAKRVHLFLSMYHNGELAATLEEMLMGIDQNEGRGAPFPEEVAGTIKVIYQEKASEDLPKQAGRTIGIRRK